MGLIRSGGHRFAMVARPRLREGDPGKAALVVGMSLLTVFATAVGALQVDASVQASRAQREAGRLGLEGTARDVTAIVQLGADYGAFRRWYEELERLAWVNEALAADPDRADRAQLEVLARVDASLADWIQQRTDLLQAPYFDPETYISDFAAYEAERVTAPAVRTEEQRSAETEVAVAWGSRALGYVTVLTLIAIALFFLGLAATIGASVRFLFAAGGGIFGTVAFAWAASLALAPVHRVPTAAIEQVVRAQVELAQAPGFGTMELDQTGRGRFAAAIAAADAALALDPEDASAYRARAAAELSYADTLVFSEAGPGAETERLVAGAVADYRRFVERRGDDYASWWNLGWAEYLAGDMAAAIADTDRALELTPDQFTLYLNRALARLAAGDRAGADADLETALEVAAKTSLDSNQLFFDVSDFDIARLAEQRPAEAGALRAMLLRLREAQVALRVAGSTHPREGTGRVEGLAMGTLELSEDGALAPLGEVAAGEAVSDPAAVAFRLRVSAAAVPAGTTLSVRVWLDGLPQAGYALDVAWPQGSRQMVVEIASPYALAGFPLQPGAYQLAVYLDGATGGTFGWSVAAPE